MLLVDCWTQLYMLWLPSYKDNDIYKWIYGYTHTISLTGSLGAPYLEVERWGRLRWNSASSTVQTAPFTFSTRLKHLCSDKLWRTAFWTEKVKVTVNLWHAMVLKLDGNSETGAHVRKNHCYLICLRRSIRSRPVTSSPKRPISLCLPKVI